jgi:hypothetical protein
MTNALTMLPKSSIAQVPGVIKLFFVRDLQIFAIRVFARLDCKKLTGDKHSSLLRKSVIYGPKKVL